MAHKKITCSCHYYFIVTSGKEKGVMACFSFRINHFSMAVTTHLPPPGVRWSQDRSAWQLCLVLPMAVLPKSHSQTTHPPRQIAQHQGLNWLKKRFSCTIIQIKYYFYFIFWNNFRTTTTWDLAAVQVKVFSADDWITLE